MALDDTTAARSSWRADLQAMKDVGIEFFIVRSSAVGVAFDSANTTCPLGSFDSYYPARAPHLLRCMRRQRCLSRSAATSALRRACWVTVVQPVGDGRFAAFDDGFAERSVPSRPAWRPVRVPRARRPRQRRGAD